jgi:hypothetical protein
MEQRKKYRSYLLGAHLYSLGEDSYLEHGKGEDCTGHGSMVSSAAAGKTYGVAKGVTLKMAKISVGCRRSTSIAATVKAINWIAENAPRGSIVNPKPQPEFFWVLNAASGIVLSSSIDST